MAIYDLAQKRGLIGEQVRIMPIATDQYPTKAKRPQNSHLSKEKICRHLDITLKPWQDSLATFLSTLEKSCHLPPGEVDDKLLLNIKVEL